ncbi:MAG: hypothetical protein KC464_03225, partial [Myxococcales bacterium]|nr:hypothetical protein [Myxococcales bacterium]
VAGSCGQPADIDARVDGADATADAARLDAAVDAAVDATPLATLRVLISGRGRVVAGTLGQCDGPSGDCSWDVEAGVMVDLVPVDTHPQDTFAGWSTANCAGETGACTVTIVAPQTLVGATFQ